MCGKKNSGVNSMGRGRLNWKTRLCAPYWFYLLSFLLLCINANRLNFKFLKPKTLDVVGSNILLLVRVECSVEQDKHSGKRLCISINNVTEKHNVLARTLFSHCMPSPRMQCSNTTRDKVEEAMVHLRLNVGDIRGVLSLLLTSDVLVTASTPRTDPFVYDTVVIQASPSEGNNFVIGASSMKHFDLALLSPLDRMNIQHGKPVEVFFSTQNHPRPAMYVFKLTMTCLKNAFCRIPDNL